MVIKNFLKKQFNKNTIFGKTMSSYLFLITYFLLFFVVTIVIMQNRLKLEIYKTHSQSFEIMTTSVQAMKNELDSCAYQLSQDDMLCELLESDWNDKSTYWNISLFKQNIDHIYSLYEQMKNIYIFFPEKDVIFDDGNILDSTLEFRQFHIPYDNTKNLTYSHWKEFMLQSHQYELYNCGKEKLIYFHTVNFNNKVAVVCFNINQVFLDQILAGDETDGKVVIYNHKEDAVYTNNDEFMTSGDTHKEKRFESKPAPRIKLAYYLPEANFYKTATVLNKYFYLLIIAYLVSAYLISVYVTKRIHRPLGEILKNLSEKDEAESYGDMHNEYDYIKKSVHNIFKENSKYINLIEKQNHDAFGMMLGKVLLSRKKDAKIADLLSAYQISFKYKKYIVGVFSVSEVDISTWGTENNNELIFFAINNIFEELAAENYSKIDVKIDESTMLLLIGTNYTDEVKIRHSIEKIIVEEQDFVRRELKFDFQVYFSEVLSSIDDIKNGYDHAMKTYHLCFDKSISFYTNNEEKILIDYNIVSQMEQALPETLIKGDLIQANQMINSLLKQCYKSGAIEFLTYTNSRLLSVFSVLLQKLPKEDLKEYVELLSKVKIEEKSQEAFFNLAEYFCNSVGLNEKEDNQLVGEIIAYINANFSDSSLNVNALGYIFNRAPSYISYLFKNSTGRMLNKFITETRVKQAEILLCSNEKIENIANLCGFSGSDSFRRIFKKYTGMTPSDYRESMMQK